MVATLPPTIDPNGVYAPKKAAQLLGIGDTTLWRYATRGLITRRVRPGWKKGVYLGRDIIKLHRTVEIY